MVEIIFIGTGGGRFNLVKQLRRTGGFRIHGESMKIHVDPGPGASLGCALEHVNIQKTDAVIITHGHLDHVCEAPVLIEAMSGFSGFTKKHLPKGILIGSENALLGTSAYERAIAKYHISKAAQAFVPKIGVPTKFGNNCEICAMPVNHDEKTAFGFTLLIDGVKIGHIGDTDYNGVDWSAYLGCDVLVMNVIKPAGHDIPDHLSCTQAIKVLEACRPKKAIITHIGLELSAIADAEAKKISQATGIEVIAAKDGMRISL